ncbi:MAG: hypothetical protein RL341_2434 [Pseudomonadota bacterium]
MSIASAAIGERAIAARQGPAGTLPTNNYWIASSELLLGSGVSSGSLPKPAGATSGDTLVVWYATDDNTAGFTTSLSAAGFTQRGVDQSISAPDGMRVAFWTKGVDGTEPASWTLTRDAGGNTFSTSVSCSLYRGLDNAALIDAAIVFVQNTSANASPVSVQGSALTTVSNGALVLYAAAVDNVTTGGITYEAPYDYAARAEADQGTFTSVFVADKVQVVPGFTGVPVGRATTAAGNAGYIAAAIAFKIASGGAINVSASDAAAASDSSAALAVFGRSASDGVVAVDSSAASAVFGALASDAATAADSASSAAASVASAADTATAGDTASSASAANAAATDAVSAADTGTAQRVAATLASDAATAADAATAGLVGSASASDAAAAADAATALRTVSASASEAASAADNATSQITAIAVAADAVTAADLASQSGGNTLNAIDAAAAADSASAQLTAVLAALDAVAATDVATGMRVATVSAADVIAAVDQAGASLVALLQAADAVIVIDSATQTGVASVSAVDVLNLIDAAIAGGADQYTANSTTRIGNRTLQDVQERIGTTPLSAGGVRIGAVTLARPPRRIG